MFFYSKEEEIDYKYSMENFKPNRYTDSHIKIAESRTIEFHCNDKKRTNNGWYKLNCGHMKSINKVDVKRGKFTCKECTTVTKYKEACEEKGLEYIDRYIEDTQSFIICKCKKCETELHKRVSSITFHESIICEVCKLNNWKQEANKQGFEFLRIIDNLHADYKCLECGEISIKGLNDMREGEISCQCRKERRWKIYQEEALRQGFQLINKMRNDYNMYNYQCLICGEYNDYQLNAMRIGNVRCRSVDCGHGIKSQAQIVIEKFISDNYEYIMENEIKFDELCGVYGSKLRFDIGLYKENNLIVLIEYDGIQHFKVTFKNDNEDKLRLRKYYDNLKNRYCLNNNIPLLRISCYEYWNDNWREKLKSFISKL